MIFKRSIYYFLLFLIIFSSCTLQKRVYRKGYYLHHNFVSSKKEKISKEQIIRPEINKSSVADEALFASNDKSFFIPVKVPLIDSVKKVSCGDSIWFSDGSVVVGKILEIRTSQIKYKRCSNIDGPTIVVLTSSVSKIKYANGYVEEYEFKKLEQPESKSNDNVVSNVDLVPIEKTKEEKPTSAYAIRAMITVLATLAFFALALLLAVLSFSEIIIFPLLSLYISALLSIIYASYAINKIKNEPKRNKGMRTAEAALGLAIILMVLAVISLIIGFFFLLISAL